MDYEKKYNEALERARKAYNAIPPESRGARKIIEDAFPELRENEDERIRKEIYDFIFDGIWHDVIINEVKQKRKYEKWLAYLEKQKESTWTEEDESFRKHILPRILDPKGWTMEQMEADRKLLKEFVERQKNKWGEKQKEQKPADEQFPPLEGLDAIKAKYYDDGFKNGFDEGVESVKPAEWSEEDKKILDNVSQILIGLNYQELAKNYKQTIEKLWKSSKR